MSQTQLPSCIDVLINKLRVVQFNWQGNVVQIPHFSVVAVLDRPIIDRYMKRENRDIGLIYEGRYTIPIVDPLGGNISSSPAHVVIVSVIKYNRFGLYGYPADKIDSDLLIPANHTLIPAIVGEFTD